MKKLLAVSLLLIIFTSQVGYYFVYTVHQYILKEEMERDLLAHIPDSSLEIIVEEDFSDKIEWEEKGKEFFLNGELYDVARIKKEEGKTLLYCINDKKEKKLLDKLVKAVNKNHDNKRSRNIKPALPDLVSMCLFETPDLFSGSSQYIPFKVSLVFSYKEIHSPPPKV